MTSSHSWMRSARSVRVGALFLSVSALALGGFFISQAHAAVEQITNLTPNGGEFVRGTYDITWSAVASSSDTVSISLSTDSGGSYNRSIIGATNAQAGSYSWDTTQAGGSTLSDGATYRIKVSNSGTGLDESSADFTVDNTPPTASTASVSPAAPNGSNDWYTTAPSITFGCTDPVVNGASSGCKDVVYAWYDASTHTVVTATTTTSASGSITAPEGDNTLVYYSEDKAADSRGVDNKSAVHSQEFKVDTAAPTITSYTLNGGTKDVYFNPSNASTTITLTASEPVTWTTVRVQSQTNPTIYQDIHPGTTGQTTTTVTWDGSLFGGGTAGDGAYVITYRIKDLAGNDTNTEKGTPLSGPKIFIDSQAPTVSNYTSPAANHIYTSSNILTFTPTDTGGAGATSITCSYALNGGATSTIPCTSGTVITNGAVSGLAEGRDTLQLSVTDAADNSVYEAPVSFVYDNNQTLTVSNDPADRADFSTIGAAIAASDAAGLTNQTIEVFPGTYTEDATLDNAFTLESHSGSASGTTIDGLTTVASSGVTVQNLTFTNPDASTALLVSGASNVSVIGNTFTDVGTTPTSGSAQAIDVNGGSSSAMSHITISNNKITNVGNLSLADGSGSSAKGIYIGDSTGTNTISDVTIDGNTISHVYASTANWPTGRGAYGILVNHTTGATATAGLLITNNVIGTLEGLWAHAIGLEGNTPGARVTGNTISGLVGHKSPSDAVGVNVESNASASTVHINQNTFDNASVPVFVQNTVAGSDVDATRNWYGTAAYNTINGKMNQMPGAITFDPYYVNAAMTTLSNEPVSDVYVDQTYTDGGADGGHIFGYNAFSAIQDAINAVALANGGTVHVAAGTYAENVSVTRALKIDGANVGVAGSGTRGSESQVKSMTVDASNVIVDGLAFDGSGSQLTISTSSATLSGDVVQNNAFSGYGTVGMPTENAGNLLIQDNAFSGPAGTGEPMQIKANVSSGCSGTTVKNNLFTAAGNSGGADANFSCTGSASSGVTVTGNTDTGNTGGTSFAAFSGIANDLLVTDNQATTSGSTLYFWGGTTGSTTIADNHLSAGSGSSGISIHNSLDGNNTGVFTISGNTISGSGYGIYVASDALGATGVVNANSNTISSNTTYGIDNNDASVTVNATKNWWGDSTGPYHAEKNPNGKGNAVSSYVDFSPFCMDSGCTAFGSVDPITQLALAADPARVPTSGTSTVTATALDAHGYTVVNDNSNAQVHFSADHGASLGALYVDLGTDGAAKTTVNNTQTGVTNVAAELVGSSPAISTSTQVTFTQADVTPPSVTSVTPVGSATGVPVAVIPQIDFSEALAQATVDSARIYLKTSTTSVPATVALVEGGMRVTITPDSPLAYDTQYTIVVSTGVTDLSGNHLAVEYDSAFTTAAAPVSVPMITDVHTSSIGTTTATIAWTTNQAADAAVDYGTTSGYGTSSTTSALATAHQVTLTGLSPSTTYHFRVVSTNADGGQAVSTDNVFTTAVDNASATLAVTGIDALGTYATPDNTFADGWSWTFHVTVPNGQNYLAMKFSDFLNGTSTIPAAGNIEYFSPQSSLHNATSTAVMITGADAYPPAILLDGADLDPSAPGKQVEVTVEVKVPTNASGGSYSASYGVKSSDTSL